MSVRKEGDLLAARRRAREAAAESVRAAVATAKANEADLYQFHRQQAVLARLAADRDAAVAKAVARFDGAAERARQAQRDALRRLRERGASEVQLQDWTQLSAGQLRAVARVTDSADR